jgi:cytochrome c peroxidase
LFHQPVFGDEGQKSNEQMLGRRLESSAAEVILGDRLFFDSRFAQYFFANCAGDVNRLLPSGDPSLDWIVLRVDALLRAPFRDQSISCRACHLGDDFRDTQPTAQRTYSDFSRRSAAPARDDGVISTVRNSQGMIDLGLEREAPKLFHWDGAFSEVEDLVFDTLIGRNMGWKVDERSTAIAHIARVIREDRGVNPRRNRRLDESGIAYAELFSGSDRRLPPQFVLPRQYRLDVKSASDEEVLRAISRLVGAYIDSLRFGAVDTGRRSVSPYDVFLARNQLPVGPRAKESVTAYVQRLRLELSVREHFTWITPPTYGRFELHRQAFRFGELELRGLRVFLKSTGTGAGNCAACHPPPRFTDHKLHNTGVSQFDYDAIHGLGAFSKLAIPTLSQRNRDPDNYLPTTPSRPLALDRFRSTPTSDARGFADLGAWNTFANPDFPKPQNAVTRLLCDEVRRRSTVHSCVAADLLPLTIARFKTPTIRNLGHSDPYFHSGSAATIEDVLSLYDSASNFARTGEVRNGSARLRAIRIDHDDVTALSAFLRSLNEDYH